MVARRVSNLWSVFELVPVKGLGTTGPDVVLVAVHLDTEVGDDTIIARRATKEGVEALLIAGARASAAISRTTTELLKRRKKKAKKCERKTLKKTTKWVRQNLCGPSKLSGKKKMAHVRKATT